MYNFHIIYMNKKQLNTEAKEFCKNPTERNYNKIYEPIKKVLYGFGYKYYHNYSHFVPDAVDWVMIKIYTSPHLYDSSKSNFTTWACTIFKNHIIYIARNNRRVANYDMNILTRIAEDHCDDNTEEIEETEHKIKFVQSFLELENTEAANLMLGKMYGHRYIDIYDGGVSQSTQKTQLRALRLKIKNAYDRIYNSVDSRA